MLKEGEKVLLYDRKGRKYIFVLKKEGVFQFHKGEVPHKEIIGKQEGETVFSSKGEKLLILRPTLSDFVLKKLKRKSQIIYPKDVGQILILGDIFPGAKVFECGTGSGALTCYLLRAVGKDGIVVSYDKREDMLKVAEKNIKKFFANRKEKIGKLILKKGNIEDGIKEKGFDRMILDLPEPQKVLPCVQESLKSGGILLCWLPTVLQVFTLIDEIEKNYGNNFFIEGVYETLQREWRKKGKSLRPKDTMIAHTGFLIVMRKKWCEVRN